MSGRVLEIAEYVLSNIMENVVGANIRKFSYSVKYNGKCGGREYKNFSCVVMSRRAVYNAQYFTILAAGWVGVQL